MSRRKPKQFRLPKPPDGDKRAEALRQMAGKMATVQDVERLLNLYHDTYVEPYMERVRWLLLPWYVKLAARLRILEPIQKARHRIARWWHLNIRRSEP